MHLSPQVLADVDQSKVTAPAPPLLELPEKVIQFGTGVLLRGLVDFFIDKANKKGLFNGRVVVVKSTMHGDTDAFGRQQGLFTHCVRGIERGTEINQFIINGAISRVLHAATQWQELLQCAHNPEIQIIVSNTTEVGLEYVAEKLDAGVPLSFPGKLLAFLWERYTAFEGNAASGMVIIPTELVPDNGQVLKGLLLQLAAYNQLPTSFVAWLEAHNSFCSSLVDRIVPGMPQAAEKEAIANALGYTDDLLIVSEPYRLWAIEGGAKEKAVLSFAESDEGVIIAPDIEKYRELKLRLLNGTHTLSCGLAHLCGFTFVKDAMGDAGFAHFAKHLMQEEIAPAIPFSIPAPEKAEFSAQVLDRFRNPYLQHQWISITMQYTSKVKMRVVPVLLHFYEVYETPPQFIALGFAAYLVFTRPVKVQDNVFIGIYNGNEYPINDNKAAWFLQKVQEGRAESFVATILSEEELWGTDLTRLPGFATMVSEYYNAILHKGATAVLQEAKQ